MKKIITLIAVLTLSLSGYSQQIPLHSLYMMDLSMINPAVAGSYDFTPISANYRRQWAGFEGAPETQYVNAHRYFGKNVGMGLAFFNEVTAPTRRTGLQFSFAYHLPLSDDFSRKISFGLAPVFFQHYLNVDQVTTHEPNDPAVVGGYNSQLSPDANFGVMFSDKNYYAGLSVFNMLQISRNLFDVIDKVDNPINRTYYFVGGYNFQVNESFNIEPSALVQYQEATPFQFDVNVKAEYKNFLGLGVSYRHLDALVYMAFLSYENFRIGYSYDMTVSDINRYSLGSHEFHLSYRIPNIVQTEEKRENMPLFY
jgi:type IX secretion system PorP/SprF family membrane protein